jgi:general secretion pathway protein A
MKLPYLSYFSLKEEPFSTVPSPRYLFLTPVHATALGKTEFIVEARKGLTVVFGETGMGKSSLARLLHQKFLDRGFNSVLLTNPSYPTPNALLRTIIQEFQLPKTARAYKDNIDLFKAYLYDQAVEHGQTVVLIMDEAQTLRFPLLELLRQLINYETNEQKLLQLVLFAQDELRLKLAHARGRSFRSRIAMASTLDRLSPGEIRKMIDFRWRVASGGRRHPFQPTAIEKVFEHSGGIPRAANILADNALLLAFLRKRKKISRKLVDDAAKERRETIGSDKEKHEKRPIR